MTSLSWDLVESIYTYRNHDLASTCKEFYTNHYIKKSTASIKIQIWYRKCISIDMDNWSKRRLVHGYKTNYEWEYFKTYPTFLSKKCDRPDLLEKARYAESLGTRNSIVDFLMDPSILKEEIQYTGW